MEDNLLPTVLEAASTAACWQARQRRNGTAQEAPTSPRQGRSGNCCTAMGPYRPGPQWVMCGHRVIAERQDHR
jgi:hypothetical protein